MTRPSITRAALVLVALAGCGGSVPEDSRVHEADPVTLSAGTLPAAPAGEDTAAPRLLPPAPSEPIAQLAPPPTEAAAPVEGVPITVRAGENLVGIASVAGVSVEEIVEANSLDARDPLHPGQALIIPLEGDLAHAFSDARDFARADRLDRYVSGRGGLVGVEAHAVRTGETAWGIAREQAGVPVGPDGLQPRHEPGQPGHRPAREGTGLRRLGRRHGADLGASCGHRSRGVSEDRWSRPWVGVSGRPGASTLWTSTLPGASVHGAGDARGTPLSRLSLDPSWRVCVRAG
jgi:LysM repeat protein